MVIGASHPFPFSFCFILLEFLISIMSSDLYQQVLEVLNQEEVVNSLKESLKVQLLQWVDVQRQSGGGVKSGRFKTRSKSKRGGGGMEEGGGMEQEDEENEDDLKPWIQMADQIVMQYLQLRRLKMTETLFLSECPTLESRSGKYRHEKMNRRLLDDRRFEADSKRALLLALIYKWISSTDDSSTSPISHLHSKNSAYSSSSQHQSSHTHNRSHSYSHSYYPHSSDSHVQHLPYSSPISSPVFSSTSKPLHHSQPVFSSNTSSTTTSGSSFSSSSIQQGQEERQQFEKEKAQFELYKAQSLKEIEEKSKWIDQPSPIETETEQLRKKLHAAEERISRGQKKLEGLKKELEEKTRALEDFNVAAAKVQREKDDLANQLNSTKAALQNLMQITFYEPPATSPFNLNRNAIKTSVSVDFNQIRNPNNVLPLPQQNNLNNTIQSQLVDDRPMRDKVD